MNRYEIALNKPPVWFHPNGSCQCIEGCAFRHECINIPRLMPTPMVSYDYINEKVEIPVNKRKEESWTTEEVESTDFGVNTGFCQIFIRPRPFMRALSTLQASMRSRQLRLWIRDGGAL